MTGVEVLAIAGTAASALGSIQQGRAAEAQADFAARQAEQRAKAERAVSQRQAIEQGRKIGLAESRARALAAAGGTSTSSGSVQDILGGLSFERDYAMQSELAAGENRALGYETQAASARMEGKAAKKAGLYGAASSIGRFAGSAAGQSLYSKYSGGTSSLPWQASGNVKPDWMGGGRY